MLDAIVLLRVCIYTFLCSSFWFVSLSQVSMGFKDLSLALLTSSYFGCSLFNNMKGPSKLAGGADFYCFKHNIEPKWEDPICANGGKWTMNFPKEKSDKPWLYTVWFWFFLLEHMILVSPSIRVWLGFCFLDVVACVDWRTVWPWRWDMRSCCQR